MTNVAALAASLARPVVRDLMSLDYAEMAIAAACARAAREGALGGPDAGTAGDGGCLADAIRIGHFLLHQRLKALDSDRLLAIGAINVCITPMIRRKVPIGRVRAEAHDINADRGDLMTETQVEAVIVDALYRAEERERTKRQIGRMGYARS